MESPLRISTQFGYSRSPSIATAEARTEPRVLMLVNTPGNSKPSGGGSAVSDILIVWLGMMQELHDTRAAILEIRDELRPSEELGDYILSLHFFREHLTLQNPTHLLLSTFKSGLYMKTLEKASFQILESGIISSKHPDLVEIAPSDKANLSNIIDHVIPKSAPRTETTRQRQQHVNVSEEPKSVQGRHEEPWNDAARRARLEISNHGMDYFTLSPNEVAISGVEENSAVLPDVVAQMDQEAMESSGLRHNIAEPPPSCAERDLIMSSSIRPSSFQPIYWR